MQKAAASSGDGERVRASAKARPDTNRGTKWPDGMARPALTAVGSRRLTHVLNLHMVRLTRCDLTHIQLYVASPTDLMAILDV